MGSTVTVWLKPVGRVTPENLRAVADQDGITPASRSVLLGRDHITHGRSDRVVMCKSTVKDFVPFAREHNIDVRCSELNVDYLQ